MNDKVEDWRKSCKAAAQRKYRAKNREAIILKQREYYRSERGRFTMLRNNLRNRYGMTVEEYDSIVASQNNLCLICGRELKGIGVTNIDHDHNTGKIRGVLCKACNRGLGMFKDNTRLLLKAVLYLDPEIPLAMIKPHGAFRIARKQAGEMYSEIRELRETDFYCYVEELAVIFAKYNFLPVIPLAEALKEVNNDTD